MHILVIGTGYVGLVTGTCFAEMGHKVICLDIDEKKINSLNNATIHFYEPGLEEILKRNITAKRLSFTTDYEYAVQHTTICFIAVGTPMAEDGSANLENVIQVATTLSEYIEDYKIIVNKSTVPVGTSEIVRSTIQEGLNKRKKNIEFDVVSNPEFLKEGDAINDFLKPDRVIIGTDNIRVGTIMREIYSGFTLSHERILLMNIPSAELTKYASNAMLALRISFMNELSELCENSYADINQVRKGIGTDKRIGLSFLYAGPGFGGSCFPKDIRALDALAQQKNVSLTITKAITHANEKQKNRIVEKIKQLFSETPSPTLAIWGLAFKPNTDDIRESPSIHLIQELITLGYHLKLFDPIAMDTAKLTLKNTQYLTWCENEYEAATDSHGIILMTEWRQFRLIDLNEILPTMKRNLFFDTRNQYSPSEMASRGFDYYSIGRQPSFHKDMMGTTPFNLGQHLDTLIANKKSQQHSPSQL